MIELEKNTRELRRTVQWSFLSDAWLTAYDLRYNAASWQGDSTSRLVRFHSSPTFILSLLTCGVLDFGTYAAFIWEIDSFFLELPFKERPTGA